MEQMSVDVELEEKVKLGDSSDSSYSHDDSTRKKSKLQSCGYLFIRILLFPVVLWAAFYKRNKAVLSSIFYFLLALGYLAYFIYALIYDVAAASPLVALTCSVVAIVAYEFFNKQYQQKLFQVYEKNKCLSCQSIFQKIVFVLGILLVLVFSIWLLIDVIMRNPKQLLSLFGFFCILLVCIWGSKYPSSINWRPVIWGVGLQFFLGVLVLRTYCGYTVVKFMGDEIATFMNYSEYGARFVFGDDFKMHFFAFKVLPMIVFFSTFTNMLFYLGLMQWFIGKISYLTQITLGTSAIESTVATANIFVGMTEAPLVVKPYLPDLTNAEIHSVLTAGLGSIAFSVFGVFVGFKVDSVHLLTACVMSAPASLVVSRMLYPEREKSKFTNSESLILTSGTDRNIVEAAAVGASTSIKLVANIAANLIAFLALLAFINSTLSWFGGFVGCPDLTFEVLCGYAFMPVAFLLGADWQDCRVVGELFGTKTFLNEFIAYQKMQPLIENRLSGTSKFSANGKINFISERSEVIAIHALCGFCNVSSLGIIIGGLSVFMPKRRTDMANMAVRALMGGILTCCMTASIAGFLFMESSTSLTTVTNATLTVTELPDLINSSHAVGTGFN